MKRLWVLLGLLVLAVVSSFAAARVSEPGVTVVASFVRDPAHPWQCVGHAGMGPSASLGPDVVRQKVTARFDRDCELVITSVETQTGEPATFP
ncbi:MAG TPA: hypothetical protein VI997_04910 [Candidatus Thermoplasmatota archaeon]|nr:hypothetical protein [Candidatus Thermoplasmatota archaeon]